MAWRQWPGVPHKIVRIVDIGLLDQEGLRQTGCAAAAIQLDASAGGSQAPVVKSCRRVSTAGDGGEPALIERVEQLTDYPLQSGLVGR